MYRIMLVLTKLNELANSENIQTKKRFWAICFVLSLIFTTLICIGLKTDYIQTRTIIELKLKALLVIALIINTTTLLINYLVSFED